MSDQFSAGGYVPGAVEWQPELGERVWMRDGRTYEWDGRRFLRVEDDPASPWYRSEEHALRIAYEERDAMRRERGC